MEGAVSARILIADDEAAIRRLLRTGLDGAGYTAIEAASGEETLRRAALDRVEAVILDLGLPDIDGVAVLKRLREWSQVPVIVLSARIAEPAKVEALDAGADDYVTKPFGFGELLARLRAALRRRLYEETGQPVFELDGLQVDLANRRVHSNGRPVRLSPKEYELLRFLVVNAGKPLTHDQILRAVWPENVVSDIRNLRVLMGQLRRKIEPDPAIHRYIRSEPGVGYRLETEAAENRNPPI